MIKVGIFTYDFFPYIGGQGKHIYELYKQNLKDKKVNMLFFSPNINSFKNHIPIFPSSKTNPLKHIYFSLKLNNSIESIIKKYDLDIAHLHSGPGGLFLLRKLSIPTVVTAHHTYWQQQHYIISQKWKYFFVEFEKKTYQLADAIICVSKDTKNTLLNHYNINPCRLYHIPNGIIGKDLKKGKGKDILYIGRLDKRKGLDFLFGSMTIVNRENPNIKLHVIGEGKDKVKLIKKSKKNNLNIEFYGYVEEKKLDKIYEKCSVQIVPSLFEGFGIAVLEGIVKRLAIIATDTEGIRELIINDYNGRLIKYGDKKALADSILEVQGKSLLREKYIKNATKNLVNYSWPNIYSRTISIYEKLF